MLTGHSAVAVRMDGISERASYRAWAGEKVAECWATKHFATPENGQSNSVGCGGAGVRRSLREPRYCGAEQA